MIQYKLSPHTYKQNFDNASRTSAESCVQFGTRLNYLFQLYINSRNVTSLQDLVDLVVADKLKSSLNHLTRVYITDKEIIFCKKMDES